MTGDHHADGGRCLTELNRLVAGLAGQDRSELAAALDTIERHRAGVRRMVDRRARRQVSGATSRSSRPPRAAAWTRCRPGRAGDPAEPGGHRRRHRGGAGPAGSRGRRRAARPRHGRHPRRGHYLRRGCPRRHTRGGPGRLRRFLLLRAGVVQDDDGAVGECGEAARPRVGRADPHRPAARARLRGQFGAGVRHPGLPVLQDAAPKGYLVGWRSRCGCTTADQHVRLLRGRRPGERSQADAPQLLGHQVVTHRRPASSTPPPATPSSASTTRPPGSAGSDGPWTPRPAAPVPRSASPAR